MEKQKMLDLLKGKKGYSLDEIIRSEDLTKEEIEEVIKQFENALFGALQDELFKLEDTAIEIMINELEGKKLSYNDKKQIARNNGINL